MSQRFCTACDGWHDMSEPWPEACASHYKRSKAPNSGPDQNRSTLFDGKMPERGHWVLDRKTGELVAKQDYTGSSGLTIIKDIEPYMSVNKEYIGGRKQHGDMLRARNVIEVGNEKITKRYEEAPGVGADIKRAIEEHGGELRHR